MGSFSIGDWTSDRDEALKYAKENNTFIFVVMTQENGCTHCDAAESKIWSKSEFKQWSKKSNIVLLKTVYDGTEQQQKWFNYYDNKFGNVIYGGSLPTPTVFVMDSDENLIGYCAFHNGTITNGKGTVIDGSHPRVGYFISMAADSLPQWPIICVEKWTSDVCVGTGADVIQFMLQRNNSRASNPYSVKIGTEMKYILGSGISNTLYGVDQYYKDYSKGRHQSFCENQFDWYVINKEDVRSEYTVTINAKGNYEYCSMFFLDSQEDALKCDTYETLSKKSKFKIDFEQYNGKSCSVKLSDPKTVYVCVARKDMPISRGEKQNVVCEYSFTISTGSSSYHTVSFYDWDMTLLETQTVSHGGNAVQPKTPTRDGYYFTKWLPTFTNITQDTKCVAQYSKKDEPTVIENHIRNQIVKANLSKNVRSIGDGCFIGCNRLREVYLGENCTEIGTSAFCGCTSLSMVNMLNDSNSDHTFDIIGDYAFSNTNISSASISLRGSSQSTFFGDYCFAYNKNLQKVNFLSSSFMANNMFCDCTALTSVSFDNDYTSYVYPYVFHNCTALKDITLPSKLWFISNSMFKGCSSLSSIRFQNYDDTVINMVQDGAFSGCSSLTSIEFPQSINSISCIKDGCFQNTPNLQEVIFDGIPMSDITTTQKREVEGEVLYGNMYINDDNTQNIITTALSSGIPVLVCYGDGDCTECVKFTNNYQKTSQYTRKIENVKCVFVYGSKGLARQAVEQYYDVGRNTGYVVQTLMWKDGSGKVITKNIDDQYNKGYVLLDSVTGTLDGWGYNWKAEQPKEKAFDTIRTIESISETGFCRMNHDCTIVTKEGTRIQFKYDPKVVKQRILEDEYESDVITKTNFTTGRWYYNIKQLKKQADETKKPILAIYSLLGCNPCSLYHDNIWNNETLQSWVPQQNFYFCGIESDRQMYYDDQLRYCAKELVPQARNYMRYGESIETLSANAFNEIFKETKNEKTGQINNDLYTPVIIMYGPQTSNLSGQFFLYTYHNIQKWLELNGKDGVVEILKRLCLYHFENNDTSSPNGFVRNVEEPFDINNLPTIEFERQKFKYYDSETNTMNMTSYENLANLKKKLQDTFLSGEGNYIGGCQVETVPWMVELGITTEIIERDPQYAKELFESVEFYKFSDSEKYTSTLDIEDTTLVYSPCSIPHQATGYRLNWNVV